MSNIVTRFREMPLDNPIKTMVITVTICFVAAVFVSGAAISLRAKQEANKINEKRRNIIQVAGLWDDTKTIEQMFDRIEARVVDLRTGDFTTEVPTSYDEIAGAKDPNTSRALTKQQDIASIRRESFFKVVYLVKNTKGTIDKVILPIHGYGLWSTLYGFMAVSPDGNTINALKFYAHAETPGLGGEVDNPAWQAKWPNKKIYDNNGRVAISVVKGGATGDYQVDALSGATLTSDGVNNLVQFWVGKDGFESFLIKVKQGLLKDS